MKYMFRKTLIEKDGPETVDKLVNYCLSHKIESCMIVTESHTLHPFPRPLDQLYEYCNGLLTYAMSSLRKNNIEAGINVWFTLGCGDFNHELNGYPEFNWNHYVDWTGHQNKVTASPCCPKWRKYISQAYRLFASTHPDYIFIDDDFRLHNHVNPESSYGSFDKLMLERYSQKLGQRINRKAALKLIFDTSGYNSTRHLWFQTLNEVMVESAHLLRTAVDSSSPKIQLGLMCSIPEIHSAEGRNWLELYSALAGKNKILCRPCMANYRETDFKNLATGYFFAMSTIHKLGKNARYCAEIENAQGGLYGKSTTMLRSQMQLAILAGCSDVTLNLYDFTGQPFGENKQFDKVLLEELPVLKELEHSCTGMKHRGIQCVSYPEVALSIPKVENYDNLITKSSLEKMLSFVGIPTTYDEENIKVISGDIARIIPHAKLEKWLSGGLLLDSSAAKALNDIGYSELIGVQVEELVGRCSTDLGCEEIIDDDLGPTGRYLDLRHILGNSFVKLLKPLGNARTMSQMWIDMYKPFGPGIIWYENKLGGRIATIAFDGQSNCFDLCTPEGDTISFYSMLRSLMMQNTINFISKNEPITFVKNGAFVMPIRLEDDKKTLVAIQSFHSDDLEVNVLITKLPATPKAMYFLNSIGKWDVFNNFENEGDGIRFAVNMTHGNCGIYKIVH